MSVHYGDWNPWHGCTKLSSGYRYCYVYRQDERHGAGERAGICRKTANFDLPVKRKRDKRRSLDTVGHRTFFTGIAIHRFRL